MNKTSLLFSFVFLLLYSKTLFANNEPYYHQQWHINHNKTFYEKNYIHPNAHINAGNILNKYTGKNIKIAIIDDSIDLSHEDLSGAVTKTYDLQTNTDIKSSLKKEYSHGTAVAGIIAARKNNKGIQGIAHDAQILFLKYKANMSPEDIVILFEKAEEFGADIINCSWVKYEVHPLVKSKIIELSKKGRNKKGTIVVFSSGNGNQNARFNESSIKEVISVGSTNKDNIRSWYSNFSENLDIVAPGGHAIGLTTLSKTKEKYTPYFGDTRFIGTSAAAAVVSGVIALMLEKDPSLTRNEIEEILKNTADKIGKHKYIDERNNYYGHGKINLAKIMEKIKP